MGVQNKNEKLRREGAFSGFWAGRPRAPLGASIAERQPLALNGKDQKVERGLSLQSTSRPQQAVGPSRFHLPGACAPVEPLYLEARCVPLPAGSPPPLFRAASSEALCWSKTSKNEASGPMGAKAMKTDANEKPQVRQSTSAPKGSSLRRPCACLGVTLSRASWSRPPAHAHTLHPAQASCTGAGAQHPALSGTRPPARPQDSQARSHLRVGAFLERGLSGNGDQQGMLGMLDLDFIEIILWVFVVVLFCWPI